MNLERAHISCGLFYAVAGMALGTWMAATHNHAQCVTHAHILLPGFVVSVLYGLILRTLKDPPRKAGTAQFWVHQVGTLAMTSGLFAFTAGLGSPGILFPLLGISAVLVLAGAVMMLVIYIRTG